MHNCGTCNNRKCYECAVNIFNAMYNADAPRLEMRWDQHPSDQHPCAHGEAVVATAVAAVEFRIANGALSAAHWHDDLACYEWRAAPDGWELDKYNKDNEMLFCETCGHRLPTAAELPAMCERWMAEQC